MDELETLLGSDPEVPEGGFTRRVLGALPGRPSRFSLWPAFAAGAAALALSILVPDAVPSVTHRMDWLLVSLAALNRSLGIGAALVVGAIAVAAVMLPEEL